MQLLGWTPLLLACSAVCLGTLRFVALFFETWELVHSERISDEELLDLCASGAARQSPRMQSACMSASAARASPALMSALVRAAATFAQQAWGLVYTPLHSFSFAGGVAALGVLPWLAPLRAFLWPSAPNYDSYARGSGTSISPFLGPRDHVVVLHNGTCATDASGMSKRLLSGPTIMEEGSPELDTSTFRKPFDAYNDSRRGNGGFRSTSPEGSRPASPTMANGVGKRGWASSMFTRATPHLHRD